jgi:hypothetical protein
VFSSDALYFEWYCRVLKPPHAEKYQLKIVDKLCYLPACFIGECGEKAEALLLPWLLGTSLPDHDAARLTW